MNVFTYNRDAWDKQVEQKNRWSVPVGPADIAAARAGEWQIVLTPRRPVPRAWFPDLRDCEVLCLASGGGQQGPILAAAGARVTVFDASPAQLAQDRFVADREGLEIVTELGDMADLSRFAPESFDLIFHPCSNCFVPDIPPVWRGAFRVLRHGGALLSGFADPIVFAIDPDLERQGTVQLKYSIPYSDLTSLTDEERRRYTDKNEPLAFGHTLEQQIGGQLEAGFLLAGFYDDYSSEGEPLAKYLSAYHATRAVKP